MIKKLLIIGGLTLGLLGFHMILTYFGYRFYFLLAVIEWATKFIFPWVALYWLIRVSRNLERNKSNSH